MKARDQGLRLKRFETSEKARKVADLEAMIRDFEEMAADLQRQITSEEDRTGVKDQAHFAYSTFAKSAALRRNKIVTSVDGLKAQLADAQKAHQVAVDELKALEAAQEPRDDRSPGRIAQQDLAPPMQSSRPVL
jgi:flagellar protein FliJ